MLKCLFLVAIKIFCHKYVIVTTGNPMYMPPDVSTNFTKIVLDRRGKFLGGKTQGSSMGRIVLVLLLSVAKSVIL